MKRKTKRMKRYTGLLPAVSNSYFLEFQKYFGDCGLVERREIEVNCFRKRKRVRKKRSKVKRTRMKARKMKRVTRRRVRRKWKKRKNTRPRHPPT